MYPYVAPSTYIDYVSSVLQHQIPFLNCKNIISPNPYAQPKLPQNIYKRHTMPSTTFGQPSTVLTSNSIRHSTVISVFTKSFSAIP